MTFAINDYILTDSVNTTIDYRVFAIVKAINEDGSLVVRNERLGTWTTEACKCEHFSVPSTWIK